MRQLIAIWRNVYVVALIDVWYSVKRFIFVYGYVKINICVLQWVNVFFTADI